MYSILTILISIINHGTIIHANKHQIQVRYFVNKEIVDKIEQIEKNILPQTEDLQCDKNITNESLGKRVGGPDACQVKANSKPWMVSFLPYLNCSGTLITKRVVLTAAHCVTEFHIRGDVHVMVGEHDTKKKESGDQFIRVKSAKKHENFIAGGPCGYLNDIGLIFLEQDAVLNDKVQLASLPDPNQDCPPGNSLILSGWGKDPFTPSRDPHILWAVKQGCLDIEKCNRVTDPLECKKDILCVGDEREPRNSGFKGDSGGPLTYTDTDGKTTTFGIVSGPGNVTNLPISTTATFVRLSNPDILDWIKDGIKSNNN